jgi:F0F1-type ATP synthase assembly protein I
MEKKGKSSLKEFLNKPLISSDSSFLKYSGIGFQLAAVILVFLFIGIWLDGKFGTKFIFTLALTIIGFFGGFYSFYLTIKDLNRKKDEQKE